MLFFQIQNHLKCTSGIKINTKCLGHLYFCVSSAEGQRTLYGIERNTCGEKEQGEIDAIGGPQVQRDKQQASQNSRQDVIKHWTNKAREIPLMRPAIPINVIQ